MFLFDTTKIKKIIYIIKIHTLKKITHLEPSGVRGNLKVAVLHALLASNVRTCHTKYHYFKIHPKSFLTVVAI